MTSLDLHRRLAVLQTIVRGLHGVRHYVASRPTLHLYGWETAGLPARFSERFPSDHRRTRLFRESPESMLHLVRWEGSEAIGTESTHHLRSKALWQLLERCTSIKTVRLFLQLGANSSWHGSDSLRATPCRLAARRRGSPIQARAYWS